MTGMNTFGLIGLTEENVGVDRRFYTGYTSTNGTFAVSYNAGRVDVFLNGIKLVGNHTGNANYDYTMDSTTGTGSTITLATGVALVSADVLECVGYVSNSSNTVTSYNPTPSSGDGGWNVFANISHTASDLVNVFLNGVLLDDSDYTLDASADTVTIGGATLTASDVVVIQVIGALDHSNFVPAGGGAFTGPITGVDVNGTELVLDADGDTSITADTDDRIDIKIGGTDVGNFNSDTLKLVKNGTPVLEVEDTAETTYSGYWLTAPEMHLKHSTDNANSEGVLGIIRFKGTTKTDLGVPSTPGSVDLVQIQGRAVGQGNAQRFSDVKGALSFRGMDGAGGFTELMGIEGKNLVIASGGGIEFNSGGDSSLLDDYEEGTYNPSITGSSGAASGVNFASRHGAYQKIGNHISVSIHLNITGYSSGPSGALWVTLPVNAHSTHVGSASIGYTANWTRRPIAGIVAGGTDRLYLYVFNIASSSNVTAGTGVNNAQGSDIQSTSEIFCQVTYRMA